MTRLRPLRYFGGKYYMAKLLVDQINQTPHQHYVEAFGGAAHVLLYKQPSHHETYNDLDSNVYSFFMTVSDPELFPKFYARVFALPYSEQLFRECRKTLHEQTDVVERAWRWFVLTNQAFGGKISAWGYASKTKTSATSAWVNRIDQLALVHERLRRVQIMNRDAMRVIDVMDDPKTLFYLDPPYIARTRFTNNIYFHEMSDEQHRALVARLLTVKGKVILSGYHDPIYDPLVENGWERLDYAIRRSIKHVRDSSRPSRVETIYIKR